VAFDAFFEQPVEPAEGYLERWYAGAIRSRLAPVKAFARMIGEHWEGVVRWHWTKINNRGPGRDQLAGAGRQAPRSRVPQQAEPDRDDLPDRRPT
jgi:hypothetical protein